VSGAVSGELSVERRKPDRLAVHIDESELQLPDGRRIFVYGAVAAWRMEKARTAVAKAMIEHGVQAGTEFKWSSRGGDPVAKAALKEQVIGIVASHVRGFLSLTDAGAKNTAMLNALEQLVAFARAEDYKSIAVAYDQGALASQTVVETELRRRGLTEVQALTALDSRDSLEIQFADLFAGAFNYVVRAALGGPSKIVSVYDESIGESSDMPLDFLFHTIFRYTLWGKAPELDPKDVDSWQPEDMYLDSFGLGIRVHATLTESELDAVRGLAKFYQGCMH